LLQNTNNNATDMEVRHRGFRDCFLMQPFRKARLLPCPFAKIVHGYMSQMAFFLGYRTHRYGSRDDVVGVEPENRFVRSFSGCVASPRTGRRRSENGALQSGTKGDGDTKRLITEYIRM